MILALDFDGVVWDSVGECYQMARRTYRELFGREPRECEPEFRAGRWLVRCGGDFLAVLELAQAGTDLTRLSKADFAAWLARHEADIKRFEPAFYRQRETCRQEHPEEWIAMQRPYPAMVAELPRLRARFAELVLCTTKDEASARALLATVQVDIPIWGREHGVHKGEQVRDLCRTRSVAASDVLFVDDLLENLEQVEPTGARLFLADWGYNTPSEQEEARRRGIPVVSAAGLTEQLCGA